MNVLLPFEQYLMQRKGLCTFNAQNVDFLGMSFGLLYVVQAVLSYKYNVK